MSLSDVDDEDDRRDGATVTLEGEEKAAVEDAPDGGAYLNMEDVEYREVPHDPDHYENLLPLLSVAFINTMQTDLHDKIEKDKESRTKRDEQYADAIRRTGMGEPAPGGADFQGASKVTHPMMTEACVDFGARTIKELCPPSGPVKSHIFGKVTRDKAERAARKTEYMNYQLTEQIPEFMDELDKMFPQVPLGGVQYTKWYFDHRLRRASIRFVPLDDVFVPWSASSFYSAFRRTHMRYVTETEYMEGVDSGEFVEDFSAPSSLLPQPTKTQDASDKVEGKEVSPYNEDGVRPIYESEILYCIPDDAWMFRSEDGEDRTDRFAPYLIKMDAHSGQLLGVFRNWIEGDPLRRDINWLTEWPCIPWRGAYAIGLPQIASGLSSAATGALRALLDSALVQTVPTAIKLKSQIGGQSDQVQVGEINTVQGTAQVDDIRKLAMPLPFNQPSPVLFQLLGFLATEARGIIRTSLEDLTGEGPNTPVGTVMARVEQGMVVFSSIHKRLHRAMKRCLDTLQRINYMYMDDEVNVPELDGMTIRREDFASERDVVPVSDPLIFSEAQRLSQTQMIAERSKAMPGLYDLRKAETRLLKTMKIEDPESLLVEQPQPKEMNAVLENLAAGMGRPVIAFPEQDHVAHLQTHLEFVESPIFGMNPAIAPKALPVLVNHIAEHLLLYYAAATHHAASAAASVDISKFLKVKDRTLRRKVDAVLALASDEVITAAPKDFQKVLPAIQKAQQFLQAIMPPPPTDPAQVAMKELENRAKSDQMKNQVQVQKIGSDAQRDAINAQAREADEQRKLQDKEAQRAHDAEQKAADRAATFVNAEQQRQHDERLAQQKAEEALALQEQKDAEATDRERLKQAAETERTGTETEAKLEINADDNATALEIAEKEIAAGKHSNVSTGKGLGE